MAADGDQERNEQPQSQPQGTPAGGGGFTMSGRTLGIAGAGGAVLLVVIIVVVVLLVTGVLGGGGGGASGGGDWLAYVPIDAPGVGIVDSKAFFGGDVPEDFAEYFGDDDGASEAIYDFVDVDEDDLVIHAGTVDINFDETLEILQGDFDFDIIREELEDGRDCENDDYRGFELWECPGQEYPAVALFEKDKYVVLAAQRQDDLEDVLTYKSREPENLANADDSDIKRLLEQTNGWLQIALLGDLCPIERCQGFAFALGKSDASSEMPASYALLFSSERAATAAEGDIEIDDLLEQWFAAFDLELDIGEVKAQGEFVVGTGEAEFIEQDDGRSSTRDGGRSQTSSQGQPALPQAVAATAVPVAQHQSVAAQPAAPVAPAVQRQTPLGGVGRDDWVGDCSEVTMKEANQFLARHEQITQDDAYVHCACLYDYFIEWEGPPPATMSDVAAGRLSAEALSFANLMADAGSYCAGW